MFSADGSMVTLQTGLSLETDDTRATDLGSGCLSAPGNPALPFSAPLLGRTEGVLMFPLAF